MQEQTTARIPLRRRDGTVRAFALVDASDYEWLTRWRWCLSSKGYAMRSAMQAGKKHPVYLHRMILGLEPGDPRQGDHKNRDRLDCRRTNLRVAKRADRDNNQNRSSNARPTSSRYRGVSWHKASRKWQATATLDDQQHYLGVFEHETDAAAAASAFRAEHMPFSEDALAVMECCAES